MGGRPVDEKLGVESGGPAPCVRAGSVTSQAGPARPARPGAAVMREWDPACSGLHPAPSASSG